MNPEQATAVMDRFLADLAADDETAYMAAMVAPQRMLAGSDVDAVAAIDKLAGMWAAARQAALAEVVGR